MTTNTIITEAAQQLSKSCMLVNLTCRHWTGKASDASAAADVEDAHQAARGTTSVTKFLVDEKYIREINKHVGRARRVLNSFTVPWTASGGRIMPAKRIVDFIEAFKSVEVDFDKAVGRLVRDYDSLKTLAQRSLGTLYDESRYPPIETLANRFGLELTITEVPVSSDFRFEIDDAVREDLARRLGESVSAATEAAKSDMKRRLQGALAKLENRLTDPNSQRFTQSLKDNVLAEARTILDLPMLADDNLSTIACNAVSIIDEMDWGACIDDEVYRENQGERVKSVHAQTTALDYL